jgi:hypothetical protein
MPECTDVFVSLQRQREGVECRRCISDKDMRCEKKLSLESNRSIFRRNSDLIVFVNLLTKIFQYAQTYALYICIVEGRKI